MRAVSDEVLIYILMYLRAIDLATLSEVDKIVFSRQKIQKAIQRIMIESPFSAIQTPSKKSLWTMSFDALSPAVLFVFEVTSITTALAFPQPIGEKGYWISSAWVSNAKKYFESLTLPDITGTTSKQKKGNSKRQPKNRQRKGSDLLPPSPSINSDLLCIHGGLALSKVSKSKRRQIDPRCWRLLRQYYPEGAEYKCSTSSDCCICLDESLEARALANDKKSTELLLRRNDLVTPILEGLFNRKSGVPSHSLRVNFVGMEDFLDDTIDPEYISKIMEFPYQQPLAPGIYNLVQRSWLRDWRRFVKDSKLNTLKPLDSCNLFCSAHGHLVIPPHLEEFLIGARKGLLGGLGAYEGIEVEILTLEEWEELQTVVMHSYNDVYVRMYLDGENVNWNCAVCHICDPFDYSPLKLEDNSKKNKNGTNDMHFK